MQDISLKDLLEAGCHFGHKAERWHPKATDFIYQERDGIHVIDLAKTKAGLARAAEFIKNMAREGKTVLFVGTKRQAANIIKEEATAAGAPFISHRWIGGFLTNWEQVHKNLEKIRKMTVDEKTDAWNIYPKHERVKLSRYLRRLEQFYGGVVTLHELPAILMAVDIKREAVAIHEADKMHIPTVGVVDTNSDPTLVAYAIPANDDAVGSVRYLVHYLANAYKEGREQFEKEAAKRQATENKQPTKTEDKKAEEAGKVEKVEKVEKVNQVEKVEQVEKVSAKDQVSTVKEKAEQIEKQVDVVAKPEEKPKAAPKKRGRKKKEEVKVS